MTEKEKAKAYDEALERAKGIHHFSSDIAEIKRMEQIFSELKESEDERIRKSLILYLEYKRKEQEEAKYYQGVEGFERWINWVEKQTSVKFNGEKDEKIRKVLLESFKYQQRESRTDKEWLNGIKLSEVVAWLEKQENSPILSNSSNIGKDLQVDGFDAELNALLKKYEHPSKKEQQEPLEFYLGVVRDDLDIVREEKSKRTEEGIREAQLDYWRSVGGKEWHGVPVQETIAWLEKQGEQKWSEEDEIDSDATIELLEYFINYAPEFRRPTIRRSIDWLESIKQRMKEQ